jgi:hypothetical protein
MKIEYKIIDVDHYNIDKQDFEPAFQVQFNVGVQYFTIGPKYETREEAEWVMEQLDVALSKIKNT